MSTRDWKLSNPVTLWKLRCKIKEAQQQLTFALEIIKEAMAESEQSAE